MTSNTEDGAIEMLGLEAIEERRNVPREVHNPKQSTDHDQGNDSHVRNLM